MHPHGDDDRCGDRDAAVSSDGEPAEEDGEQDECERARRKRQEGEEREAPARIFSAAGRAELWAAGTGQAESASSVATHEEAGRGTTAGTDEVNTAFRRSGLLGE